MALLSRLADALLTCDATQRLRLKQTLLGMGLMAFSIALLAVAAHRAGTPRAAVVAWALASGLGLALMFAAIRSGWSQHLADPSLTLPQMALAILSGATAYAMAGAMRGAAFPVLMVIMAFGMFRLAPRTMAWVSAFALACFGVAMAAMALHDPAVYEPHVELAHFVMLAVMLPAMSILAARLGTLRARERQQRLELQQAMARIQELATRDALTGLVNRRHMAELLEQERLRAVRSGRGFCVVLADIDHFKSINDRFGHATGDEVLRHVAREARASVRTTDTVARWGGEEFVLLMPDAYLPSARAGAERLRRRVSLVPAALGAGEPLHVTVSCGLAEHLAGESIEQVLERADRALYEAKSQGRNRTVVAPSSGAPAPRA